MNIGTVGEKFGVPAKTIRCHESIGLTRELRSLKGTLRDIAERRQGDERPHLPIADRLAAVLEVFRTIEHESETILNEPVSVPSVRSRRPAAKVAKSRQRRGC